MRSTDDNYNIEVTEKEVVIRKMTVDRQEVNTNMKSDLKLNVGDVNFTEKQKEQFDALLKKHSDAFCKDDSDLGHSSLIKHSIKLTDDVPIRVPHRRIPPNQLEEVKQHIRKLLDQGIIRKSTSPYASAIVIVRKKGWKFTTVCRL